MKKFKTKERKKDLFLADIFEKLAPKIGAKVLIEPEWRVAAQITFKNGTRRYCRYNSIDLNHLGSSDISCDKDYANFFMKNMGYPTIQGQTFFSSQWAKAVKSSRNIDAGYRYAKKLGFPIVVKPNDASQGTGVAVVHTKKEFYRAMRFIFEKYKVALVQRKIEGRDYRIVILNKKVISVYERIPLSVVGDGKLSIKRLLEKKQKYFITIDRDTKININDPRIKETLKRQGFNLRSILAKNTRVYLLSNANLSTGGDSVDVTKEIHPEFKKLAVKLMHDMGLRFCGLDIMVEGDINNKPLKYWVIEINDTPGLDHYAASGKAQEKIVEDLYLEVLKSLEK